MLLWLAGVVAILAASDWWSDGRQWGVALVFTLLALRYLDIVRWYLGLLLDRRHRLFLSYERNILFYILNLVELIVIAASALRWVDPATGVTAAGLDAFFLVTLLNVPPETGRGTGAIEVATVFAAFLFVAGVLSILVSGVSERTREKGADAGPG